MASHLPLLLNPLLNVIFNNPQPTESSLKDVYQRLSKSWEDGTVIVVPPLDLLLNFADAESGTSYASLCATEEFIKDHIICTSENKNAKLFFSYSGKESLIKKDVLFTGKGYKRPQRLNILRCEYFRSFNNYFPRGRRFMVVYVDGVLSGHPQRITIPEAVQIGNAQEKKALLDESPEVEPAEEQEQDDTPMRFEQVMRTFPLVSKSIGEKYDQLFRSFNVRDIPDGDTLIEMFNNAVEQASLIFQTLNPELVNAIMDASPNRDLNECVYNYVEMNLHDKLWNRLCDLHEDEMNSQYPHLEHISLNQVSLPDKFKTDLRLQSILEKRLARAIVEFQKLELTTDSSSKVESFVKTVTILSNMNEITIDADTLVGLLLIVVSHTGVMNLENHLFYVQSFSFQNTDAGMVGYALSTFEGLMYYLKEDSNLETLKKYSTRNKAVFGYIDTKELLKLKHIADSYANESDSPLKSRTTNGESLLMQAIQSNDYDTWKLLIDYEQIFTLEDILADQNINDTNLLNAALNYENFDIVDEIVEILFSSCTSKELIAYLNKKDSSQRTIGHYLFHYPSLIKRLSPFINWTSKDMNGQTPLFAICRSYDSGSYDELIEIVFTAVNEWYERNNSEFDYEDHIDHRGNTLLHVLNSNIQVALRNERVNVNECNKKYYTPLMIYAKYNRVDNIRELLKSDKLNVLKVDKNFYTAVDHSKNAIVSSMLDKCYLDQVITPVEERQIGLIRVLLENNVWKLVIRGNIHGADTTVVHPFKNFKNLILLLQIEFPNTFIPLEEGMKCFDLILNFTNFNKLKLNVVLGDLNNFLQGVLFNGRMAESALIWGFLRGGEYDYVALSKQSKLKMMNTLNEHATEHSLQPEEISEMNFFLKFSLKELFKLRALYDKLFKVVNFQARKSVELKHAMELFADSPCDMSPELTYLSKVTKDCAREFVFDDETCDKVLYLYHSSEEMINKMNDLMNHKIFKWWKLYGELIEMNKSYKKFKSVELNKANRHLAQVEDVVVVNEESFQDLTSITSFTNGSKKKAKPGFLTNFIESRRSKFEQKMLDGMRDVKQELAQLSKDIKFSHETLAVELNNFFNFKTDMLRLILKKYTKKQLEDIKFSTLMLERGLRDMHL